jgi:hypothetical protein
MEFVQRVLGLALIAGGAKVFAVSGLPSSWRFYDLLVPLLAATLIVVGVSFVLVADDLAERLTALVGCGMFAWTVVGSFFQGEGSAPAVIPGNAWGWILEGLVALVALACYAGCLFRAVGE